MKLLHKWAQATPACFIRKNYKTEKSKATVYPTTSDGKGKWRYRIEMSDGKPLTKIVDSKEEGQKIVDEILRLDGWKFLDDDKLNILLD